MEKSNKPLGIHTDPGYISAGDDASIYSAIHGRGTGMFSAYEGGCKLNRIGVLSVEMQTGVISQQGFMYRVYEATRFNFEPANPGEQRYGIIAIEYERHNEARQTQSLKIIMGKSSTNPVKPSVVTKDLQKENKSTETLYEVLIVGGNIEEIKPIGEDLSDENLKEEMELEFDKKYAPIEFNGYDYIIRVAEKQNVYSVIRTFQTKRLGEFSIRIDNGANNSPNKDRTLYGTVRFFPDEVALIKVYGMTMNSNNKTKLEEYTGYIDTKVNSTQWNQNFGQVIQYGVTEPRFEGNVDGDVFLITEEQ